MTMMIGGSACDERVAELEAQLAQTREQLRFQTEGRIADAGERNRRQGDLSADNATLCALVLELKAWVDDLQSGMYVNCVYCGHRYGPKETTPVSMADALKMHVERCPQHPMSRLKADLATARDVLGEIVKWGGQPPFDGRWAAAMAGAYLKGKTDGQP